jgi:hypothetical protein
MAFFAALMNPARLPDREPEHKDPPPPAAPPPPAMRPPKAPDEGQASAGVAAEMQAVRKRRGQRATILTSPLGAPDSGQARPKTLGGA